MSGSCAHLYVHLVWATKERLPLIDEAIRDALYGCIHAECSRRRAEPIAIGGMEDHVHLLTRFSVAVSVADLVKQVKGASSHFVARRLGRADTFRWQQGYGAFTVARTDLERVRNYVNNQAEHHRMGRLSAALERPTTGVRVAADDTGR